MSPKRKDFGSVQTNLKWSWRTVGLDATSRSLLIGGIASETSFQGIMLGQWDDIENDCIDGSPMRKSRTEVIKTVGVFEDPRSLRVAERIEALYTLSMSGVLMLRRPF